MAPGFRRCGPFDTEPGLHPLDRSHRHGGPIGIDDDPCCYPYGAPLHPEDEIDHWLGFRYPDPSLRDRLGARLGNWRDTAAAAIARIVVSGTLRQAAADLALEELRYWTENQLTEARRAGQIRIQQYWRVGNRRTVTRATARSAAWSAAFISYAMRQAGAGTAFRYAWKHVTYVKAAIDNLQQDRPNTFKAYKIDDPRATPTVGDLVCNWRDTRRTYDEIAAMRTAHGYTHCDLVVGKDADGGRIQLVGGNKRGGVVGQVEIALESDGRLRDDPPGFYIAVLRHS